MIVADTCIQIVVIFVREIDYAAIDAPAEMIILIFVGALVVVIDLRSCAVMSMRIGRNKSQVGVLAIEGVLVTVSVDVGVVHTEVTPPFT